MSKLKDYGYMVGQRYGRLVVRDIVRLKKSGRSRLYCVCDCDCGNTGILVMKTNLTDGPQKSCGCLRFKTEQDIIRDHSYLVGQKFGKLTVVRIEVGKNGKGHKTPICVCKCECGNEGVMVSKNQLATGKRKTCGCLQKYHIPWGNSCNGDSMERIYNIWVKMVGRCFNPHDTNFIDYGGRGISVCEEWTGDEGYSNFKRWAFSNGYEANLTIDRTDNDQGYSPSNCRWVDAKTQANNRRVPRNSKSGVRGVSKMESGRWSASVYIGGKKVNLGRFDSLEDAAIARNRYISKNGLSSQPSYISGTKDEY